MDNKVPDNKMLSDGDKLIKAIDTDGNGRITQAEVRAHANKKVKKKEVSAKMAMLRSPNGNQHVIPMDKLEEFKLALGVDDTWEIK